MPNPLRAVGTTVGHMSPVDLLALALAAKRLTRLVTTDWIGEWAIVRPAKKWAYKHEGQVDPHMPLVEVDGRLVDPTQGFWRTKGTSGLDCDWCVGIWAGAILTIPLPRPLSTVRSLVMPTLVVSQLVGMLAQLEHQLAVRAEESMYTLTDESPHTE